MSLTIRRIDLRQHSNQSGQALVFAVLTLFSAIVVALAIHAVGDTTSKQIRLQSAADAAAYSGAEVLADCYTQIAWINEGLADVYYETMRTAADHTVLSVMHEYHAPDRLWRPEATGLDYPAIDLSPDAEEELIGIDDIAGRWEESCANAEEIITNNERWLWQMSRISHAIAIMAPTLVEHQVFFTAAKNSAERIFWMRNFKGVLGHPSFYDVNVTKIGDSDSYPNGWRIFSETGGAEMIATHVKHDDYYDVWNVVSSTETGDKSVDIEAYYDNPGSDRPARFEISVNTGEENLKITALISKDGQVLVSGAGVDMGITPTTVTDDQGNSSTEYSIKLPGGKTIRMRWGDNGEMEVYDSNTKTWQSLSSSTTVVGGVEVPIVFNPHIKISDDVSMDLSTPLHLHIDALHVTLTNPLYLSFSAFGVYAYFRDQYASLNCLRTDRDADSLWKHWGHGCSNYWNRDSRARHRIVTLSSKNWRYEFREPGAYFENMSPRKFAVHAIIDRHEELANSQSGSAPWLVPPKGDSKWKSFPCWASVDQEEGWWNIEKGAPKLFDGSQENQYYFLERPCWYCGQIGDTPGQDIPNKWDGFTRPEENLPLPLKTREFPRPCGFWLQTVIYDHGDPDSKDAKDDFIAALKAGGAEENKHFKLVTTWTDTYPDPDNPDNQIMREYFEFQVRCPLNCTPVNPFLPDRKTEITDTTVVVKSVRHAYGRAADNRPEDWQDRVADMGYNYESGTGYRDYFSTKIWNQGDKNYMQSPLQLSTEVFIDNVTVVVWAAATDDSTWRGQDSPEYQQRRLGQWNPLKGPRWGHFAMASARPFGYLRDVNGESLGWVGRFDWESATALSLENIPENDQDMLDVLERPRNFDRERWVLSLFNLFEPSWCAALVPLNTAVEIRDEYEHDKIDSVKDNNAAFLFRELALGKWRESVIKSGGGWSDTDHNVLTSWLNMQAPPNQKNSNKINWDDPKIGDLLLH